MAALVSSQSSSAATKPLGASQANVQISRSPCSSPSVSAYQTVTSVASTSSVLPSQSSSWPLQLSIAPGNLVSSVSSQSPASSTALEDASQASTSALASP